MGYYGRTMTLSEDESIVMSGYYGYSLILFSESDGSPIVKK